MEIVLVLLGGLAVVVALTVLRNRSRAKAEVGLTSDELKRKKALEDMADNLTP